jgi:hypothetical protein
MGIQAISVVGKMKTGKSTFAVSAPKPLIVFDFELGMQRVEPRFIKDLSKIRILPYADALIIDKKRHPQQAMELWDKIIQDYKAALEDPKVKTIVFDTFTSVWEARRMAYLAELKERDPSRISLMPQEYFVPNTDMKTLLVQARLHNKILIVTHHTREVYIEGKPSGMEEADGFKYTGDLVDVELWMTKAGGKPIGKIVTCGLSMTAEGLEIPEPTFAQLEAMVDSFRSIGESEDVVEEPKPKKDKE